MYSEISEIYNSGYTLRMYQILEEDLVDFLTYIPLEYYDPERRKEIISPRLSDLLIRIGSQIDIFFRYWNIVIETNYDSKFKYWDFLLEDDHNKKSEMLSMLRYPNYIKSEEIVNLKNKNVILIPVKEELTPFEEWNEKKKNGLNKSGNIKFTYSTEWWKAYNNVKHRGYIAKQEGNLENVVYALAALFLLNCVHKDMGDLLLEYGYVKKNSQRYPKGTLKYPRMSALETFHYSSKLFGYGFPNSDGISFDLDQKQYLYKINTEITESLENFNDIYEEYKKESQYCNRDVISEVKNIANTISVLILKLEYRGFINHYWMKTLKNLKRSYIEFILESQKLDCEQLNLRLDMLEKDMSTLKEEFDVYLDNFR